MKNFLALVIAFAMIFFVAFKLNYNEGFQYGNMESAVSNFISSLNEEQKSKVIFSFDDDERKNWHYTGKMREGLPVRLMNTNQREKAFQILKSVLSPAGYEKTKQIMVLEGILRDLEGRGANDMYRNPENYYVSVFGTPGKSSWGWRFEGHHISLNFSSLSNQVIASTPSFYGANPAIVPSGKNKGMQVLKEEEEYARELVKMLEEDQLTTAIIADRAPREIITGAKRKIDRFKPEGLPYNQMNAKQQEKLKSLVEVYFGKLKEDLAGKFYNKIEITWPKVHFAWAGSMNQGEPHYYRIHHPDILIEYDNTQNNANHIHTVIRDFDNDFGEDLLKKHYEDKSHTH